MEEVQFLQEVQVKPGALGLNHGERVAGRVGTVVDRAAGSEIVDELGNWAFLRFEDEHGVSLFYDWVRLSDLAGVPAAR